ncbi:MAG: glycosyltransferase family 9 protein [Bacteroidota bacterium]
MNVKNPHVLFIRLSSLGDVALTIPVIKNFILQNPTVKVSVVSKSFHAPLFDSLENIHFIAFDSNEHKGFLGLLSFIRNHLYSQNFTHIIDLHDVLRSKIIRLSYLFKKVDVTCFDKGRAKKLQAIQNKTIQHTALIHVTERYANAIRNVGFKCELKDRDQSLKIVKKDKYSIGIAPLSKHFTKNFPLEKLSILIRRIVEDKRYHIKILCASKEQKQLTSLMINEQISFLSKESNFKKELDAIKELDLVISMDSANMHIASIYQVPVITIWGGTHPNIGFTSYYKNNINIQTDLACRPCSIYGRSACPVGHFNCMMQQDIESILSEIKQLVV